jgi:uncharacterized protein YbjQ (UPF0145 family)
MFYCECRREIGANAVVGVDFETAEYFKEQPVFSAYGTAVIAKPKEKKE